MAKVTKPASKSDTAAKAAPAKAAKPAAKASEKSTPKELTSKKESPAKATPAAKTPATAKKASPATTAKKETTTEETSKAVPEKKAAAPKADAKKATAPVKEAPSKKETAPKTPAKAALAAKEAPKKAEPAAKAAPAKPAKPKTKKTKEPVKKVITAAAFAARTQPAPQPSPAPRPTVSLEPKKAPIVIAHRPAEQKKEDVSRTMINYSPDATRSLLDRHEDIGPVYRYSDEELGEFRELVQRKLETARKDLTYFQNLLTHRGDAGTEDTDNRYQNMEDGSAAHDREQVANLASRQIQFINNLEKALVRIENKTYGICRVTGKLIDKKRLQAVPHATLSVEAKLSMRK